MLRNTFLAVAVFIFASVTAVSGQGIKPSRVSGDVASISDTKIVVNAKDGAVEAVLSTATVFKRVSPENPNPTAAVAATLSDVAVGDMVTITGVLAADGKSIPARAVYIMTKSDLSQKKAKDTEAWRTRGIAGKVATVNAQTGQITIDIRNLMGSTSVTVTPKPDAKFIRYAPDSEKFDEARTSSLGEIKAGDNLRALGDKSADGTAISAETILTGSFQTVAGTVVSVDAAKNEVVVNDLQTKKPVTISLATASTMKRFPPEMAERMAAMQGGGPAAGGGVQVIRPAGGGNAPAGGGAPAGANAGPRPMGAGRPGGGGIDEMLERFPTIAAADLKAGDMIAVSSTKTNNPDHIRAIKLLAGVEPFVKLAQMQAAAGGTRSGGGGRGVDFNIPGLDGMGP